MLLLAGQGQQVVAAHNQLHDFLVHVNGKGKLAKVTPRLQEQPTMRDAIAEAIHTLEFLKKTATIISGVTLVQTKVKQRDVGDLVGAWLKAHPRCSEDDGITAFWNHIKSFASNRASPEPSAKAQNITKGALSTVAKSAGQGLKRVGEQAASSASSSSKRAKFASSSTP